MHRLALAFAALIVVASLAIIGLPPGVETSRLASAAPQPPRGQQSGRPQAGSPKPTAIPSPASSENSTGQNTPNPARSKSPAPSASTIPGPTFVHVHINAVQFAGAKVVVDRNTTPTQFAPEDILALLGPSTGAAQQAAQKLGTSGGSSGGTTQELEIDADLSFLEAQRDQALNYLRAGVAEFHRAVQIGSRPIPVTDNGNIPDDLVKAYANSGTRLQSIVDEISRLFAVQPGPAMCRTPLPVARFGLVPIATPSAATPFESALACLTQELNQASISSEKSAAFKARLASLYASIGIRGASEEPDKADTDIVALLGRERMWANRLQSLVDAAKDPTHGQDFRSLFDQTRHIVCGPAATTYAVYFKATDLTAQSDDTQMDSPKTLVQCGSAQSFSIGAGFSTFPNRIPAIVASRPDTPASPGASPVAVNRFTYLPNDSKSGLAGWYGLNTRLRESTDDSAYYLSLAVKPNFKDFEAFVGPSLLLNKSIFITPGLHIGPSQQLAGGWNIGDLVPASVTAAPTNNSYIARFGIMLSFPVTSFGSRPAATAKSPSPSASPSAASSANPKK